MSCHKREFYAKFLKSHIYRVTDVNEGKYTMEGSAKF